MELLKLRYGRSDSEGQLQAELQVAWRKRTPCLAKLGTVRVVVSQLKARMVEDVEGFHSELQLKLVGDPKVLED